MKNKKRGLLSSLSPQKIRTHTLNTSPTKQTHLFSKSPRFNVCKEPPLDLLMIRKKWSLNGTVIGNSLRSKIQRQLLVSPDRYNVSRNLILSKHIGPVPSLKSRHKTIFQEVNNNPAPNFYQTRQQRGVSFSIGKSNRSQLAKLSRIPGPGAHFFQQKKVNQAFTIGKQLRFKPQRRQYFHKNLSSHMQSSLTNSGAVFSREVRKSYFDPPKQASSVGPGQYILQSQFGIYTELT